MKVASCPHCGQSGMSWNEESDGTRVRRFLVERDESRPRESWVRHYTVCPNLPSEEMRDPEREAPALARSAAEVPEDRSTQAALLLELLTRPSLDESRVSEMIAAAIARVPHREPTEVRFQAPELPVIEIESPHHCLATLVQYAICRVPTLMVGPAGSGKSTAAEQVARVLDLPYYEIGMGPHTSQWDLLGHIGPIGTYIPGKLREPYEYGGVFFVDELDAANPSALITVNGAIANGHCAFPDAIVAKHPDFVILAGANTYGTGANRLYVGRNQLDASTLDRFAVIYWDYDERAEIQWAGSDQSQWTEWVQVVRARVSELGLRVVVSPRASILGARLLRVGLPRDQVAQSTVWKGMSDDDRRKVVSGL